jgi:hypothetical protein
MKKYLIFATLPSMFLTGMLTAKAAPPFTPIKDLETIEKNEEKSKNK